MLSKLYVWSDPEQLNDVFISRLDYFFCDGFSPHNNYYGITGEVRLEACHSRLISAANPEFINL